MGTPPYFSPHHALGTRGGRARGAWKGFTVIAGETVSLGRAELGRQLGWGWGTAGHPLSAGCCVRYWQ